MGSVVSVSWPKRGAGVFVDVARTGGVLSAPARPELLWRRLADRERELGGLAAALGHAVPALGHHRGALRRAGLVHALPGRRRRVSAARGRELLALVEATVALQRERRAHGPAARRGDHA